MMTGSEYIESIKCLNMNIYCMGEKINSAVNHPLLQPSLNSVKATYDLAFDPNYQELMVTTSHLTGHKINRFTSLHQSCDDLIKKVK